MPQDPFAPNGWAKLLKTRLRRWGRTCARPCRPSRWNRGRSGPDNLLVLAVDTLRYDHLGLAGYGRQTTPNIDRLGATGTNFSEAMAPAPWTLPSFASSLTGLMPCLHGAALKGSQRNLEGTPPQRLRSAVRTLAQHLEGLGYRTAAFYSNPFFAFGLAETFQSHAYENVPAAELADMALEWVRRHAERPFCCFVLFNDPHEPTTPTKKWLRPYLEELARQGIRPSGRQLRALTRWGDPAAGTVALGAQSPPLTAEARQSLLIKLALYDAAVRYVDDTIGKVMDRLARWRLAERTLVTIYSDHGEEFWDHLSQAHRFAHDPRPIHGIGHGHTHFQELLHVPWLATGPGVPAGVRRDEPVSLCDVAPTLLEWLGLDPLPGPQVSLPGLAGRSQAAAPREGASRHILAEDLAYGPDLVALRRGPWKLIAHRRGDPLALHHLVDDPGEQVDLIADEPAMTADLAQAVLAWRRAIADPAGAETPGGDWKDISGAVRKRLRDLGYTD